MAQCVRADFLVRHGYIPSILLQQGGRFCYLLYDHIEYIGEMKTLDDLHEIMEEEFISYLTLYAIEAGLTDEDSTEE
ncbi:MAG: hypothetical protein Q4D71_14445 [Oscillospiraceae bacterium]|nr:hypothetical protein [Oscillospiraceae bacterium]